MVPAVMSANANIDSADMFSLAESLVVDSIDNVDERGVLLEKIGSLENILVTYIDFESGKVYNSERGYVGGVEYLDLVPYVSDINTAEDTFKSDIEPMSQANPTPSEILGGTTGAFERRQLGYGGFDKITSNVTLPTIMSITAGEQSWVYYGFDPSSGNGIEGGFAHQTGRDNWAPFVRYNGGYAYASSRYDSGNTVGDVNFVIKKANSSDTYYKAYLLCGTTELVVGTTDFTSTDVNTMSVKRMTTIAKEGFNGSNIETESYDQKYANVNVRRYYENTYKAWDSYSEYSAWKNGKWYGTVDCTDDYVHRDGDYVSIYQ